MEGQVDAEMLGAMKKLGDSLESLERVMIAIHRCVADEESLGPKWLAFTEGYLAAYELMRKYQRLVERKREEAGNG